jgi:putative Mg2+ transporter-C (MgtC) family protein
VEAESQITRAIAARSLMLREIRAEQLEETDTAIVQAVLEATTNDANVIKGLAEELRTFSWTQSVDWTETGAEAE